MDKRKEDWDKTLSENRDGKTSFLKECRAIFIIILILGIIGVVLWFLISD